MKKLQVCDAYFRCYQEATLPASTIVPEGGWTVFEMHEGECDVDKVSPTQLQKVCETIGTLLVRLRIARVFPIPSDFFIRSQILLLRLNA